MQGLSALLDGRPVEALQRAARAGLSALRESLRAVA
jgi:hypothetical protein